MILLNTALNFIKGRVHLINFNIWVELQYWLYKFLVAQSFNMTLVNIEKVTLKF